MSSTKKWFLRLVAGFVGLLLLGALYQAVAVRLDASAYTPVGQMVDVNGRLMHLSCVGEGAPTVVLDSGLSGTTFDWALVQPELAKTTRVCAYDRAGYGWSQSSPNPRTSPYMVEELHQLLTAEKVPGPYIIVGHSFGGLNAQLFASRYPAETAGLVLVDGSAAGLRERLPEELRSQVFPSASLPRLGILLNAVGLPRLLSQPVIPETRKLPTAAQAPANALGWRATTYQTFADELAGLGESEAAVLGAAPWRSDLPIAVITAPMKNQAAGQIKRELHEAIAKRSSAGQLIEATKSGHFVQIDQPELVIQTINAMVVEVR